MRQAFDFVSSSYDNVIAAAWPIWRTALDEAVNVFDRSVEFEDKTRWLIFQAAGRSKIGANKLARKMGMSKAQIKGLLFDKPRYDVGSVDLRTMAEWFYFTIGRTPEFRLVPLPEGVVAPMPRSLAKRMAASTS